MWNLRHVGQARMRLRDARARKELKNGTYN